MSLTQDLKWSLEQRSALKEWVSKQGKLIFYIVLYVAVPQWTMTAVSDLIFLLLYIYGRNARIFRFQLRCIMEHVLEVSDSYLLSKDQEQD